MPAEKLWKYYLGLSLLIYSFVPIFTVELLFFLPLNKAEAASLAVVYVASGEVSFLGAVALLGKPFVESLKTKIKSFFVRKKPVSPPKPIGKIRHTVGVTLFFMSFLPYPIVEGVLLFGHPSDQTLHNLITTLLAGDVIFIMSLFVLGGEFWERLKRLFEWPGKQKALGLVLIFMPLLAGCGSTPAARGPEASFDIVLLESGPVVRDESGVYKGIPYAAPPTGMRRWRPPQAVAPWSEPHRFDNFGPVCPQPGFDGRMSEDCLYLNIWTPVRSDNDRLPVMVWIHGGAFVNGSGSDDVYDGAGLSAKGVVLVTLNYRLGPLGFMAHPGLSAESPEGVSGNYGLLDQVAALRWVRRNIAQFGGDPEKVTIFGESAGAESVSLLLVNPLARGLFRSAIAQSPVMVGSLRPLHTGELEVIPAETVGVRIAEALGIGRGPAAVAALRATPWEKIDEAASKQSREVGVEVLRMVCTPTVDGYVIPDHPVRLFRQGRQHPVPLITGVTANESTVFLPSLLAYASSPDAYRKYVETAFPGNADEVLKLLPPMGPKSQWETLDRLISAKWFGAWADFMVQSANEDHTPAWFYRFTRRPPPWAAAVLLAESSDMDVSSKKLGVPHGSELFYVFGFTKILLGFDDEDREFSDRIMTYWTNFAKTGNPNGSGLPDWPGYGSPDQRAYLSLGAQITADSRFDVELFRIVKRTWLESAY